MMCYSGQMSWLKNDKSEHYSKRGPGRPRRKDKEGTPVGDKRLEDSESMQKDRKKRKDAMAKIRRGLRAYKAANPSAERLAMVEHMIAEATQDELFRRLDEAPENMTDTVLIRLKDSSINTIARAEQWDKAKGADAQDALSLVLDRMKQLKGKIRMEVSFQDEPDDSLEAEIIQVQALPAELPDQPQPPDDPDPE